MTNFDGAQFNAIDGRQIAVYLWTAVFFIPEVWPNSEMHYKNNVL